MSDIRVTVPPLEDLREAFAKFDTANDGVIPVHDLGALLRSVGVVELREDELQALISEELFDKNFDLPEFLALMVEIGHTLPAPGTEKKELRKAFKEADGDGDGYLTAAELRQAMDGSLLQRFQDSLGDAFTAINDSNAPGVVPAQPQAPRGTTASAVSYAAPPELA